MGNRQAAEQVILKWVGKLDPSGLNVRLYKNFFEQMNDKQFDAWMTAIEEGRDFVSMNYMNLTNSPITVDNNLKVAGEMGHEFFQQLWLTDNNTGVTFLTPKKYLVVDLPVRRQIQMLVKKISIPEDNRHVDDLTDQPTGVSKGSSLSFPEMLLLYSSGLDRSIEEMIKFRGGDSRAMNAMERSINETGAANLDHLGGGNSRVKATQTLSTLLKGMHLDNNF